MLVIVVVVGVGSIIAAPSLASMIDGMKVDQTIAEVRIALQDSQRQAIRQSKICMLTVDIGSESPDESAPKNIPNGTATGNKRVKNILAGNCLTSGAPELPTGVDMVTNILGSDSADMKVEFGLLGGADFSIASSSTATSDNATGKIVALVSSRTNGKKRCIAISNTLGLTRVGNYVGETIPNAITNSGICTAFDWDKQ
jgi:Tfp pilus assembly protein FimT